MEQGNTPNPAAFTPSPENLTSIETLDAAKVALQWTMERLQKLEQANSELKTQIASAQAGREEEYRKIVAIRQTLEDRTKHLEEEALFYQKLGGTLKLLCDGKLDVGALVQKQLELETIQKRLSEEHQKRLLDLEQNQREISERWHQRLLELESTYAQRLNRARESFEALRQKQESADHSHLRVMEDFFRDREKEFEAAKRDLMDHYKKRSLELEETTAKKQKDLEAEYQALATHLRQEIAAERETLSREERERIAVLESLLQSERQRLLAEMQKKEAEVFTLRQEKESLEQAFTSFKAEHHKEMYEQIEAFETDYKKKSHELDQKSRFLEEKSQTMEAEYIERRSHLEAEYEKLRRELQESALRKEEQFHRMEAALRSDFEKEKELITSELKATIDSSQKLAQQIREMQEGGLQEAIRKDALWSKTVEELKIELSQWQAKYFRDVQEKQQALEKTQKEMMDRDAAWAKKAADMENEFESQIRFQQEVFRKKTSELDLQLAKQREGMEREYQDLKAQIYHEMEAQKQEMDARHAERVRLLENTAQAERMRHTDEIQRREADLALLRKEKEEMSASMASLKAEFHKELNDKIASYEEAYKSRLAQVEAREQKLESDHRLRDKAFMEEREALYADLDRRRKEMDELEKTLLKRMSDLELAKQEQERLWQAREEILRQRDREWHNHRQRLEAAYSQKSTQLEQLKDELIREISSYKGQKNGGIGHG